jgi:hypothetical protein
MDLATHLVIVHGATESAARIEAHLQDDPSAPASPVPPPAPPAPKEVPMPRRGDWISAKAGNARLTKLGQLVMPTDPAAQRVIMGYARADAVQVLNDPDTLTPLGLYKPVF